MSNPPLARILRQSQGANLLELLAQQLSPSDLQSLLLEVYRLRAAQQNPAVLLSSYERNRFVHPSPTHPLLLLEIDQLALSLTTPLFEPLELAPICPLGTNSIVASVDQNKTIATIRNTELVSDSTNVLALECAARRRRHLHAPGQARQRVRLCASHRLLRPQRFDGPGAFAHFRLFALCTAGRDEGSYRFELDTLLEHVSVYVRLLSALATNGFHIQTIQVSITDLTNGTRQDALQAGVLTPLAEHFPQIHVGMDSQRSSGRNYYNGVCFAIYATDQNDRPQMLVDGGFTTWTQQLLSNQKERLLISGIGTERLCAVFGSAS